MKLELRGVKTGARSAVLLALSTALALPVYANAIREEDLRPHIATMASDEFEGREPGTAGEAKTLEYLSKAWAAAGLKPGASGGKWLEPVPLLRRGPETAVSTFYVNNSKLRFAADEIVLVGRDAQYQAGKLPLVFAGHGVGSDGKPPSGVAGKAVFILADGADFLPDNMKSARSRREALIAAGAEAVIAVAGEQFDYSAYRRQFMARPIALASQDKRAPLEGAVSAKFMVALVTASGGDWDKLRIAAKAADFGAKPLGITADFDVRSAVTQFNSHNVIGKISGKKPKSGAVVFMGHWDHLGLCRPEGEADRICNGAVDNASGMAVLTEVARKLARSKHDRDIYFVGTTAEESGLLGAQAFADKPVIPLESMVVALNIDTIAVAPKGSKVVIIGRGTTQLDSAIEAIIRKAKRIIEPSTESNAYLKRQDGWVLTQKGVPALMIGGSFSDQERLELFLSSDYHGPDDEYSKAMELGGAAEDATLHVMLGRYFASAKKYVIPMAAKAPDKKTGG
jgi:Peptidase family M28